jgi:hypothetical protein
MSLIERKPIRFCARHEEEMVDPGERDCLGAEMSPCEGEEVEYVPAEQLQGAVEQLRRAVEALHRAHAALDAEHGHTTETWADRERWPSAPSGGSRP